MDLGSTQSLTEMSTRSISWGKGGRCLRLTTLLPSFAVVMKSGNLKFLEPSGPLQVCNRTALTISNNNNFQLRLIYERKDFLNLYPFFVLYNSPILSFVLITSGAEEYGLRQLEKHDLEL